MRERQMQRLCSDPTHGVCANGGSIKKRDMQGLMRVGVHAKSQRSVRGLRSGGATKRNTLENNRDMSPTPNVPLLPPSTGSNTEHESPFYLGSGLGCTTQCRLDEEKQTLAQLVTRRCLPGGGTGPHEAVLTLFDLLNCYAALSLCEILYLVTAERPPLSFGKSWHGKCS